MKGNLSANAYAKINLYLHITGKRDDGYHLLDGMVIFADIYDHIEVHDSEIINVLTLGEFAGHIDDSENIALLAARLLAARADINYGAEIILTKNLPVAAGIGGGSSDAAAVLKLLNKLWEVNWSDQKLAAISLPLGADVPMCVIGKAAHISGIGEMVKPFSLKLPEMYLLLANPGFKIKSADIYKMGVKNHGGRVDWKDIPEDINGFCSFLSKTRNDLEENAIEAYPIVENVKRTISAQEGCLFARMSGSGPTCFGIFKEKSEADKAAAAIKSANPKWWVKSTTVL